MSLIRQCGALVARNLIAPRHQVIATARYISAIQPLHRRHLLEPHYNLLVGNFASKRGHKNFGHKDEKTPNLTRVFHLVIGSLFVATLIDWSKVKRALTPKVDAKSPPEQPEIRLAKDGKLEEDDDNDDMGKVDESGKKKKKEKVGFRERKIIEYENRVRQYSTPDKVFRYFATIRLTTDAGPEICMTPDDFLRSIYPGMKQPEGLGLDQYRRYDPKSVTESLDLNLEKDSIFYTLGSYGLITFSDYIFLLTVLSTSRRHFEIAFQMFDLNGDGDVDCEEFEKVANLVRQQTSIGNRHRDHVNTGNTFKGVNSALTTYFFGPKLDEKLTIEKFLNFQQQLQREILSLEFSRKKPNEQGQISETDFASLLLAYAGYPQRKENKKLKRVKRRFSENSLGISKKDYLDFFHFLNNINDVDTALTFYHIAGASIDPATLKHVARTVAKVDLSDHVIEVVFTIFDDNNDNQLSNREFVAVMKNRVQRGLEKPKDTGFLKLMHSILKCAKETKPVLLDI